MSSEGTTVKKTYDARRRVEQGCGGPTGKCSFPMQGQSRLSYWSISIYTKSNENQINLHHDPSLGCGSSSGGISLGLLYIEDFMAVDSGNMIFGEVQYQRSGFLKG
jgi:hypothetical protein